MTLPPLFALLRPRISTCEFPPCRLAVLSFLWLTMQSGCAGKTRFLKPLRSLKPLKPWCKRRSEIADSIESLEENITMVACTACVNHSTVYYYDQEQSVKCAECL